MANKQYHFVVFYDSETDMFELDYDTQSAKFNDEPIWNKDTEEWEELQDSDWERDESDYNRAGDLLHEIIKGARLGNIYG